MRTKFGYLGLMIAGLVASSLLVSGVVLAAEGQGKHHHHHGVHGKITVVEGSTITVAIHHHHKKDAAATEPKKETKTITITDKTKIEIAGEKGVKTPGTLADLVVGAHIAIHEHEGTVEEVTVLHHHGHHKKKAA